MAAVDKSVACGYCKRVHRYEGLLGRGAICEGCGAELRCCVNCRFYDETAYNECSEPSAERVVDKEKSNFCDYFSPPESAAGTGAASAGESPLSDLDRLFKK